MIAINNLNNICVGNNQVDRICIGDNEVYSRKKLTNSTVILYHSDVDSDMLISKDGCKTFKTDENIKGAWDIAINYDGNIVLGVNPNMSNIVKIVYDSEGNANYSFIPESNAVSCDISDDGNIIVYVNYSSAYVSYDAGKNFNYASVGKIKIIRISGDGKYMIVCGDDADSAEISVSSNSGKNFTTLITKKDSAYWFCRKCAISRNGKYMAAITHTQEDERRYELYISNDYGTTFDKADIDIYTRMYDIDVSEDGMYMVICSIDGILISSDYGRSWSTKNFIPAYCSISDVSISANCKVIICQVWNSRSSSYDTYLSLDKGNSWSIVNNSKISYINMNKGCILK